MSKKRINTTVLDLGAASDATIQTSAPLKAIMEDQIAASKSSDESTVADQLVKVGATVITPELQVKLDNYDSLVAQNSQLLAEKEELTEKLATYIEEVTQLRAENKVKIPSDELSNLQQEHFNLKNDYSNLRKAADKYLERISDLTFENANLNAQLKQIAENGNVIQSNIPAKPKHDTRLENPPYNPYRQNGYDSWN